MVQFLQCNVFGVPEMIHSDKDKQFISKQFSEMCLKVMPLNMLIGQMKLVDEAISKNLDKAYKRSERVYKRERI